MTGTMKLQVTAAPGEGIEYYEIRVRHGKDAPVTLQRVGNVASIELAAPESYMLLWYLIGKVKSTLELTVTAGGKPIWAPFKAVISDDGHIGAEAGIAPFTLGDAQ